MSEPMESIRRRWRVERQHLRLDDPECDAFGTGGLARLLDSPSVRLVVLPANPDARLVEFDEEFWEWFRAGRPDPVTEAEARWGTDHRPTTMAAVRGDRYREKNWTRFLAVSRHGGLEVGLGSEARYSIQEQQDCFRLTLIVGRLWCALEFYREVIARFGVEGPWQVTLVLLETSGTFLGDLAEGWQEPDPWHDARPCNEPNVLHITELDQRPGTDEVRKLAFRMGGWIEDSWGYTQRRFVAHRGEWQGRFDTSQYGW